MESADIIIIGGGAAGLMAAYELSKEKKKVLILEARDRLGGRIHTITEPTTGDIMEAGAEFIHGNLPLTFKLLNEAGIKYYPTEGKNWLYKKGALKQGEDMIENWDVLMSKVQEVKEDIPLSTFLNQYLNETKYEDLRRAVTAFVEGYDAADTTRTSTLAMKAEWMNEDQWDQYRSEGGYGKLVAYLESACRKSGVTFHLSAIAKQVKWSKDEVLVTTADGKQFTSMKIVVAVPLGVLQAAPEARASLHFSPHIPDKMAASKSMGYGAVIKILLGFREPFWNDQQDKQANKMKEMGYLFTDTSIPTWWTQFPTKNSLLTGWLAGPNAAALKDADDETITDHALGVLAGIFSHPKNMLKEKLQYARIFNWAADPFSLGAYAYSTLQSAASKKILNEPVADTIYFTGEALGKENESGTVEIALAAGETLAHQILTAVFHP